MIIFSPKKGQTITIIMKKVETILISADGFLGKFYLLTGVTLKFYQKSNSSIKKIFKILCILCLFMTLSVLNHRMKVFQLLFDTLIKHF